MTCLASNLISLSLSFSSFLSISAWYIDVDSTRVFLSVLGRYHLNWLCLKFNCWLHRSLSKYVYECKLHFNLLFISQNQYYFYLVLCNWVIQFHSLSYIFLLKYILVSLRLMLKAGVGYIRKNKPQFWHFLFCTQAVKISRSSWGLSLIWLANPINFENDWHLL